MSEDDAMYFYRRAEVHLSLAERAWLPQVVSAHYQLASAYLDKLTPAVAPTAAGRA